MAEAVVHRSLRERRLRHTVIGGLVGAAFASCLFAFAGLTTYENLVPIGVLLLAAPLPLFAGTVVSPTIGVVLLFAQGVVYGAFLGRSSGNRELSVGVTMLLVIHVFAIPLLLLIAGIAVTAIRGF